MFSRRHDAPCGYIIVDLSTHKRLSDKHYKSSAGAQRSKLWKQGNVEVISVDFWEEHYNRFLTNA